jgi:hypothetical protein
MILKAITIKQPYAHLISIGAKPVENRVWRTSHRGPILIHASSKPAVYSDWQDAELIHGNKIQDLKTGGIVGLAYLTEVVDNHESAWFLGPHAFVLTKAQVIPFIKCPGALGIWPVPPEIVQLLPTNLAKEPQS